MPQPSKNKLKPLNLGKENIGERIARVRKFRGLSQIELAESIGITRKQVVDYETGRTHLNDELVARFSLALEISSDELLGLTESELKTTPPPLKYMRRIKEIEKLPDQKKKAILRTLDDLIRANS